MIAFARRFGIQPLTIFLLAQEGLGFVLRSDTTIVRLRGGAESDPSARQQQVHVHWDNVWSVESS